MYSGKASSVGREEAEAGEATVLAIATSQLGCAVVSIFMITIGAEQSA
jgi:hypothetical protein